MKVRALNIRSRLFLAALLPLLLLSVFLVLMFEYWRIGDIEVRYAQNERLIASQLVNAAEYGFFSRDRESLQAIADNAVRDGDVQFVQMVGQEGEILAQAGQPPAAKDSPAMGDGPGGQPGAAERNGTSAHKVIARRHATDAIFEDGTARLTEQPITLGYVKLSISRRALASYAQSLRWLGLSVMGAGALFASLLAVYLGRGVIRPIMRISSLIKRIGSGELSVRGQTEPGDPFRDLTENLNEMAQGLQRSREELQQLVEEATKELRQKKDEAESATQAKSRFLANASHDLRQPVQAMAVLLAQLRRAPLDADMQRLVMHLDASLAALLHMLNALLDMSKLEAGAVQVDVKAISFMNMLDKMASGWGVMAEQKGLRLRLRKTNARIMSDETLLMRMINNLVANALSYTRVGGVLVVGRRVRKGRYLRIEVWDSGIGIAPEHQQEVFKEFFQLDNAERDRGKGLGLGLNIVERSARLLGHRLRLCSIPGRGTRVSIEVPLSAHQAAPDSAPLSSAHGGKQGDDFPGLKVLVIEDDSLVGVALQGFLKSMGCDVHLSRDLMGAVRGVEQWGQPNVIISDYRLLGPASGLDVIRRIRQLARTDVPACLLSGNTDSQLLQLASQEPAVTLLHKPVNPEELCAFLQASANRAPGHGGAGQLRLQ